MNMNTLSHALGVLRTTSTTKMSHAHISLGAADAACRAADLWRTLADINALDLAADVIIHTGDVFPGGRREDHAAAVTEVTIVAAASS